MLALLGEVCERCYHVVVDERAVMPKEEDLVVVMVVVVMLMLTLKMIMMYRLHTSISAQLSSHTQSSAAFHTYQPRDDKLISSAGPPQGLREGMGYTHPTEQRRSLIHSRGQERK